MMYIKVSPFRYPAMPSSFDSRHRHCYLYSAPVLEENLETAIV